MDQWWTNLIAITKGSEFQNTNDLEILTLVLILLCKGAFSAMKRQCMWMGNFPKNIIPIPGTTGYCHFESHIQTPQHLTLSFATMSNPVTFTVRRPSPLARGPSSGIESDSDGFKVPPPPRRAGGGQAAPSPLATNRTASDARLHSNNDSSDEEGAGNGTEDEIITGFNKFGVTRCVLLSPHFESSHSQKTYIMVPPSSVPLTPLSLLAYQLNAGRISNTGRTKMGERRINRSSSQR
jgi:hypothetical protein